MFSVTLTMPQTALSHKPPPQLSIDVCAMRLKRQTPKLLMLLKNQDL